VATAAQTLKLTAVRQPDAHQLVEEVQNQKPGVSNPAGF
jgi:hypothetical protein